jgi:hypothetical protein
VMGRSADAGETRNETARQRGGRRRARGPAARGPAKTGAAGPMLFRRAREARAGKSRRAAREPAIPFDLSDRPGAASCG